MRRWLIVEDDPALSETLAETLLFGGMDVAVVKNGKDAIECMDKSFNGALIDFHLPDVTGEMVLTEVKKRFGDKKYAIMSGDTELDLDMVAARSGADMVLRKPLNIGDILNKLNQI